MNRHDTNKTIIFFTFEAFGHINPLLSIAIELQNRGFDVYLLTIKKLPFAKRINDSGVKTEYCVQDDQVLETPKQFEYLKKNPKESFQTVYSIGGALDKKIDMFKEYAKEIEHKLSQMKPDLILYDHIVGCPFVTTVAKKWIRIYSGFPSILHSSFHDVYSAGLGISPKDASEELKKFEIETKAVVREKVQEFFRDFNAGTWDDSIDLVPTSKYLNFYLGPKELGYENDAMFKPLPDYWCRLEHTLVVGDGKPFCIPEKLKNKPGKLIYFSLGTLANCDFDMMNRLLKIFSKMTHRFIVSLGPHAKELLDSDNIYGKEFIDQKSVLKTVDLFISHGGHNSIIEAFYFGVPLVVFPVFADQFDSAQRIQDCNFGYRLNVLKSSEDEVTSTVEKALYDDDLKKRYKKISERMQSIRYDVIASDKIESLLDNQ